MNTFDTVVLGLGAMGSATVYQLAKRGHSVLGIDQFSPPHTLGSSHGDTRIIRQAIGEGEEYTPLSLRSYALWREIEVDAQVKLLEETGGLVISNKTNHSPNHAADFFDNTIAIANKYHIPHEVFNASQIREKFPQFYVQDDERGYYEYHAGYLRPEACISAQLLLAEKYGAHLHCNEKIISFSEKSNLVHIKTDQGEYQAKKLIITAGPWLPTLLAPNYAKFFTVFRQVLFWFDVKGPIDRFEAKNFPVFIWEQPEKTQSIYGFPAINGQHGGVKIATAQYTTATTADSISREVSQEEFTFLYENFIKSYFPDISNTCLKTAACAYTVTPDSHFVIDQHPEYSSVIIVSPCSGHGFKHSAAIGEVLAQQILDGKSKIDVSRFSFSKYLY